MIFRLVVEGDSCLIYHSLDNSKVYKEKEPRYLEVEAEVILRKVIIKISY
jgi:hypothetical protein